MIATSVVFSLLSAAAYAQSTVSAVDIAAEQANFEQSLIVPDLLAEFNPTAVLAVTYDGSQATYGQNLTISQVASQPNITVTPESGASGFDSDATFTVAMVDPSYAGADQSAGQTRHWLTNNVKLIGSAAPYSLNYTTEAITAYGGPYPASGDGPHRYTILLLPQPENFTAPAGLDTPGVQISTFDFAEYVSSSGLEQPVAGFYYQVEQGVATVTPSATSAVVTSTLAAAVGATSSSAAASSAAASSAAVSGSSASHAASSKAASSSSHAASASAAATSAVNGASSSFGASLPGALVALVGAGVGIAFAL
ncbi:Phosphatidylethanolamine binding protein [Phaffia rhodozyma]|uniref:Phosphatidylethanolamine binding protein n=1 Tax=Phaffia rhodozyma TaxID=264483 RepID=A0A0F7SW41_PHARH|nr:Phosphatidylethanolamine binding protein [Phaffia rhodozyma]